MDITIRSRLLAVTVSEHGAELQSIRAADGTEFLWQGDPAYWPDRAPILFPYVARLTKGCYRMDGELHRMKIHGFALYSDFRTVQLGPDTVTMELRSNEETRKVYPREFTFSVTYILRDSDLTMEFRVRNEDARKMYFGLGGHPGFRVPNEEGLSFDQYHLRFRRPCDPQRIGFTKDCFLDGTVSPFPLENRRILRLDHRLFDNDAIVLRSISRGVSLESEKGKYSVTVYYPQMPFLGIWHMPKTDAPYVCVEPWLSLPSGKGVIAELETQRDLVTLGPGKEYLNRWGIRVDKRKDG